MNHAGAPSLVARKSNRIARVKSEAPITRRKERCAIPLPLVGFSAARSSGRGPFLSLLPPSLSRSPCRHRSPSFRHFLCPRRRPAAARPSGRVELCGGGSGPFPANFWALARVGLLAESGWNEKEERSASSGDQSCVWFREGCRPQSA